MKQKHKVSIQMKFEVVLTPDPSGGFVVTFPEVPNATTQGEDVVGCLNNALDCLQEAMAGLIQANKKAYGS